MEKKKDQTTLHLIFGSDFQRFSLLFQFCCIFIEKHCKYTI